MARIVLDPGHAGGNTDPGAVNSSTGLQEADVNLTMGKLVSRYLSAVGHEVVLTRTEWEQPETDSLSFRCDVSNNYNADVFLSLHCNSADSKYANGTEIYTTEGETQGDQLATCIMNQVTASFPDLSLRADWADGDSDKEEGFYVIRYTDAPAALFEIAFISNMDEAANLANPRWVDDMAKAVARGVTDYLVIANG